MELRTRKWLVICVLALMGAAVFWRLGEQRLKVGPGREPAPVDAPSAGTSTQASRPVDAGATSAHAAPVPVALRALSRSALTAGTAAAAAPADAASGRASLRLRNTTRPVDELARDDAALLLRNALIDTATGTALPIPSHLRAGPEPGAYIAQADGPISESFRRLVTGSGAQVVSYLPNNAYLVQANSSQSANLAAQAGVRAVIPFEPYFKLEPALLAKAVKQEPVAAGSRLNLTLLPGTRDSGLAHLQQLGATVVNEYRTPFGPALTIDPASLSLAAIAGLPEVQGVELFRQRQLLNDLTRSRLGISFGTNAPGAFTNHLGLTGTNVHVNVNDSGIDASHPDLARRVTGDVPSTLIDFEGHGTHVAGTLAGNGSKSASVSNAIPGSLFGADFRGMAPGATLYAQPIDLITGPLTTDSYLQGNAATNYYLTLGRTNLLLSNNSWGYTGANDYDSASASYDAATRDALPEVTGAQPILFVFAAGNEGFGGEDGQGGEPSTLRSPGTGKNVITVGAVEMPRNITNEIVFTNSLGEVQTNAVFLGDTDTDYQIAAFSSRGNVEPGVEGTYGRFKPDVVAPGSFVFSARSKDWTDPRSFSDAIVQRIPGEQVVSGGINHYSLFVPEGAGEFRIRLLPNLQSPNPFPGLPMYLRPGARATTSDLVGTNNILRVPPDATLAPGVWYYAVGNGTPSTVGYDILSVITLTNEFGSYFDELKKLNDAGGEYYRYESGSSMATPAVTGLLALFEEYFEREGRATSPALLKALLINGARSLGSTYNFNVRDVINLQGWGLVNLTNVLPAGEFGSPTGGVHAVQYAHQTGSNALVTGESRSWKVTLAPDARDQIVKFTLVWTDPPGNPSAGLKLVNDLDLEVRNEETGEIVVGNDIPYRSDFNTVHPDATTVTNDAVNNVENILLRPPVGTNYTVTVRARRVNVNAVASHPDGIAQDFALVASLEDTSRTNAMTIVPEPAGLAINVPLLVVPTNGLALLGQRVGAIAPRFGLSPGQTNQWRFFVFTNLQEFTPPGIGITNGSNVAFITFLPPNLGNPRYRQADIDLYVSRDPAITNLVPSVIAAADKSRKPGGTELVYYTNAALGAVYYVGVKSEDQQAAEFGFVALSSNTPFDEDDPNGNRIVYGLPSRLPIPDGSPDQPQAGYVFGVATRSFEVQRVVVTNTLAYDSTGDIVGNLSHNEFFSVLNNHALSPEGGGDLIQLVYDDSNAGDIAFGSIFARPTDGPGRLTDFVGTEAAGPWILSVVDNAVTQTSTNVGLSLLLQPRPVEDAFFFTTILPNSLNLYYIDVPANATNLTVSLTGINPQLPLRVAIRRGEPPTPTAYDKQAYIDRPGSLSLGIFDVPPLNPGRYYIGVFNENAVPVRYGILVEFDLDLTTSAEQAYGLGLEIPIRDNGRTTSVLTVAEDFEIADFKVGIRATHPRISDLVFHVVSPQGVRLLLSENRGGPSGTEMGGVRFGQKVFTTFTDNTNLTTTPIKQAVAPFIEKPQLSSSSNRVVFSDSFERAVAGDYVTGATIPPFWEVVAGAASVVVARPGETNTVDGSQYLVLGSSGTSRIRTTVNLTANQFYRVRFHLGRFAGQAARARVEIPGFASLAWEIPTDTLPPGWYAQSVLFRAPATTTEILLANLGPGPLGVDMVTIEEADPPLNAYYLPEEALKPIIGQRSAGQWRLEVTDTRAGPDTQTPLPQFEWRLEMIFARPAVQAIRLTNNVPYFGSVSGTEIRYFYVDVPRCATISSNVVAGEDATLLLFGDRDGLPRADVTRFTDDYGPYLNLEAGGRATFRLDTRTPPSAPLVPGQRYYLAVRNFQPDLTNNAFGIRVQFDCVDPLLPVVPSLTNGVPTTGTIDPGANLHYYQFVVSSNAIRADFELTPLGGNVDMYVRRGRLLTEDFPLPSPVLYDYAANNPDPGVVDQVSVGRISQPEPLVPGVWFVAIRNTENVPVNYSIQVTETYTTIVNLTNAVSYAATIGPVDPVTGPVASDYQYYAFLVSSNSVRADFETLGADGNVNLYVRKGLPIPTPSDFHFSGWNGGNANEFISVTNTTEPIWLGPGWWFLTVENADVTNVTYSIRATEIPGAVIALTNDVPVTNSVGVGPDPAYYSFNVSPAALSAKFEVFGMTDDVHLLLRRGLPLPHRRDTTYLSQNPGLTDETIELTPFSFPEGLTPGDWYLGVLNASTNPATFVVRASEQTARVIPLTNGVPQNGRIHPGGALDYYEFHVSEGATAAEFRLTSAGAGDLDLYLRKGPPLPNAANAQYAGLTVGTGDELIRIETNSAPIPLSPGLWYLAVTNKEAAPIGYEITATEFGVVLPPPVTEITDIVIGTNNVCITWVSIPGTNYYVVARSNVLSAAWTPISPTLTAIDASTTWCLEPVGPWRVFDVLIGDSPLVPIPAPVPVLRLDGLNLCVGWESIPGTSYYVEGRRTLADTNWTVLTPKIVAAGPFTEVCYPVALGFRFFRVSVGEKSIPAPTPIDSALVDVVPGFDTICISWPSRVGLNYLVQAKRDTLDPNWTVVSESMSGTGARMELCLPGTTEFRYFQVLEGITVPTEPPASLPVPGIRLSVDGSFQLCLTWDALVGGEYFVEGKERLADAAWTVLSPILTAATTEVSYCQSLAARWRYFQVRRVNSVVAPPPTITSIEVTATGPRLVWTGPAAARYQVFYSDDSPIVWKPLGDQIASPSGTVEFVDDGTAVPRPTGAFRLYRIQRLP